ncbi:N-6 DNA methylase [Nonomuraea sp. K274]|uniref:site-specific DNA-methyltransferase (adenine-specific) n=1 Tax=Nonomuraea cypriaca TaxID=1187855 RepID=A0A931A518_9ACTN|nr:N-6 DNA methylase [Nonomuraea cypriaca]MBF8184899.1 N-6 DNA methylase [Nonomuraea cypriaca]
MTKMTRSEISARLFAAADALRGYMRDPVDLMAGLLVLKRAHDQPEFLRPPSQDVWNWLVSSGDKGCSSKMGEAFRTLESLNQGILSDTLTFLTHGRIPDSALWRAIQELNSVSLADGDLEFTDTLGKSFDAYLRRYAESEGKGGAAFYTPPSVAELAVRLVAPSEGNSVHDPFAGTGSMLIQALKFIKDRSGSKAHLRLSGQELVYGALAQLNLLLHGITDAEIRQGNSLTDPAFLVEGAPERFDRVICNPPFSTKYDDKSVSYPERMKYGWATPAHADFMNIQHAMASLKTTGRGAIIAPHGILFRSGADAAIRRRVVDSGRLVAVIGIGANVFYGTAIPACILVFDGEGESGTSTRNDILFINAEREIVSGRTKNQLEPQNIELIVNVFEEEAQITGFSRLVSQDEIAANGYSLGIRQYVDSHTSFPPPLDAMALLYGGVPRGEVQASAAKFHAHGISIEHLFRERDERYYDFLEEGWETTAARIAELGSTRKKALLREFSVWWNSINPRLEVLRNDGQHPGESKSLTADFAAALAPLGIVDRYRLAGVFARWWALHEEDIRRKSVQVDTLGEGLRAALEAQVAAELQRLIALYKSWGERYGTSLADVERQLEAGRDVLNQHLKSAGFAWP